MYCLMNIYFLFTILQELLMWKSYKSVLQGRTLQHGTQDAKHKKSDKSERVQKVKDGLDFIYNINII